jgi:hypothetical protein
MKDSGIQVWREDQESLKRKREEETLQPKLRSQAQDTHASERLSSVLKWAYTSHGILILQDISCERNAWFLFPSMSDPTIIH